MEISNMQKWVGLLVILSGSLMTGGTALADSVDARCDVYPAGADHTDVMIPCHFYQAQGHVVITRSDGIEHDLMPDGETPGNFTDQDGNTVYRQSGLGDQGLIFRFPEESVFVYWNTAMLNDDADRPDYVPAADLDFDATAWTRCKDVGASDWEQCPSGVLRMDGGQGSVVIEDPEGETFTINFMADYVNATNREVEATLDGDIWTVIVNGERVYEVMLALIEGG
ncbi:MAG: hypothetical protein V2I57_14615 [Xanthomonadales bacterium]|nr:hypothetical protein [Xanthomonadales bacterium]